MPETPTTSGTTSVSDHRPVPRGVLPRGIQTWLMVGLAGGMLLIILVAGRPATPARQTMSAPAPSPSPDRVRDYQERLRALEAQAMQEAQSAPPASPAASAKSEQQPTNGREDPLAAERRRREYESRFASNISFSRRASAEPSTSEPATSRSTADRASGGTPSIDEIADAVVRATAKAGAAATTTQQSAKAAERVHDGETNTPASADQRSRSRHTDRISAAGPLHRVLEGTVIETALTNRLDGSGPSPVNCLVTTPLYSHGGQQLLIPIGARILGESKPVQSQGESRLAVAFHRLMLPDGSTYSLDLYPGLNQIGDSGLRDRVNQHYWSIFGAAAAVGLVSGFAQAIGASANVGEGDRTVVISGGAAETTAQATMQVMNRFLNRLPSITIREGHRVQIYLTSDLELPAYEAPRLSGSF
jgi:type IV secretion system protein TrbI